MKEDSDEDGVTDGSNYGSLGNNGFTLSSVTKGSEQIDRDFINTYRNLPVLWNPKHKDYTNKYRRNAALDILVPIMKKWHKAATRYHVRSKINVLRSFYRKVLRRYLASKTIGFDGEEVYDYIPRHWKFEALKFIDVNNESGLHNNTQDIAEVNVSEASLEPQDAPSHDSTSGDEEDTYQQPSMSDVPCLSTKSSTRKKQKLGKKRIKVDLEYNVSNSDEMLDREYEAIGANVACKLKRMNVQQKYLAELLINKVLINGLKNNLTDNTDLTEVYMT